jgi:predicted phosphodiesterase
MKLNVLSDLHLSKGELPYPSNAADVVVLAGDIARPEAAMKWAAGIEKPVLYVPGNHEFYGGTMHGTVSRLKSLSEGTNVVVLDDDATVIEGVRFLGSTLWTDFRLYGGAGGAGALPGPVAAAAMRMHDFSRIYLDDDRQRLFTPRDAALLFGRHAAWLDFELDRRFEGPTVVITHHAPSARSIEARFHDSPLNACFASRAEHLLGAARVDLWIHGHMHHSVDYELDGTRVISNPRGYVTQGSPENPRFDVNYIVDVPSPLLRSHV